MHKNYFINIGIPCKDNNEKAWAIYKSGDIYGVINLICHAKNIVFKTTTQTCKIEDCFYIQTKGMPRTELEKDKVYDTITFIENPNYGNE